MYAPGTSAGPLATTNGLASAAGNSIVDVSGTIDPAALNAAGHVLPASNSAVRTLQSQRGQKRSRSPTTEGDSGLGIDDDYKSRKRGRASDQGIAGEGLAITQMNPSLDTLSAPHAPQGQHDSSPGHASPVKGTPTKSAVVKALPTVRDHTTDQLNPEGDEYIAREHDPEGEKKVSAMGHLTGGREYKMKTFYVPNRGDKLFMLATECARVLGYRDSYLLFNKNRSLHKIIANQIEKDDLIQQEILPYSYRSRQIAIVSARSMFRQFGARVIVNGRRVRDDYWEGKARKQGFTEEDMAGDKRPGATKARDAAAAAEIMPHEPPPGLLNHDIEYRDLPLPPELSSLPSMANPNLPIPMIQADPRGYGAISRQRQDLSGIPYSNRTQSSSISDIMHQATNAADLNKGIAQQRDFRAKTYKDAWNRHIDPHIPDDQQVSDMHNSPRMLQSNQHSALQPQHSQLMSSPRYQQAPHGHSPGRSSLSGPSSSQQRSSVYNPNQQYGAMQQQQPPMWGQPPPPPQGHSQTHQPSALAQQHSFSPGPHAQPPQQQYAMGVPGMPQQQQQQQRNVYAGQQTGSPHQQHYMQQHQQPSPSQGGMQWGPPAHQGWAGPPTTGY